MSEITEAAAMEIAQDSEGDVLAEARDDDTQSSVCLRKFPSCFLLGASCEASDIFKYYAFTDLDTAQATFDELAGVMRRSGTPFGALS